METFSDMGTEVNIIMVKSSQIQGVHCFRGKNFLHFQIGIDHKINTWYAFALRINAQMDHAGNNEHEESSQSKGQEEELEDDNDPGRKGR